MEDKLILALLLLAVLIIGFFSLSYLHIKLFKPIGVVTKPNVRVKIIDLKPAP